MIKVAARLWRGKSFYVTTKQGGCCGIKYRLGGLRLSSFGESVHDLNSQDATTAIYNCSTAWNAVDNNALFDLNHAPKAVIYSDLYIEAIDRASGRVATDFQRSRNSEGWSHTTVQNINAVHVMSNKVIFELEFESYNTAGKFVE
jgi:hypothetical protein